jgi:Leucine-rich repeat (LRR) protein
LEEINISNNNLKDLPKDIFLRLSNLLKIQLQNNKILHLYHETFANLTSLSCLNLRNTRLYIDVDGPKSNLFKGLKKLQILELSSNFIRNLTTDLFQDLTSLKLISLTANQITSVKSEYFRNNLNLEKILFHENKRIKKIDEDLIDNMMNLKVLYLIKTCANKNYGNISIEDPPVLSTAIRDQIKSDLRKKCHKKN